MLNENKNVFKTHTSIIKQSRKPVIKLKAKKQKDINDNAYQNAQIEYFLDDSNFSDSNKFCNPFNSLSRIVSPTGTNESNELALTDLETRNKNISSIISEINYNKIHNLKHSNGQKNIKKNQLNQLNEDNSPQQIIYPDKNNIANISITSYRNKTPDNKKTSFNLKTDNVTNEITNQNNITNENIDISKNKHQNID